MVLLGPLLPGIKVMDVTNTTLVHISQVIRDNIGADRLC